MGKIETLEINGRTVRIQHDVEHEKHRATPHELALQYARRGQVTSLYTDYDVAVQRVLINSRCIAVIKKTPQGQYFYGNLAHRDRDELVKLLLTRMGL